jgi:Transposase DDE domain
LGRPIVLHLTPGNVADIKAAPVLLAAAGRFKRLIADRGYDAADLRRALRHGGAQPVIPGRRSRKRPIRHDETLPRAVAHRSRGLPAQGFPPRGHPLRQARGQLPVHRRACGNVRLLVVIESRP